MFRVSESIRDRRKLVWKLFETEPAVAVLVAATEFEWILCRAIIALGTLPNKDVRQDLVQCRGLQNYKKAWNKHVKPTHGKTLVEVIPEWQEFRGRSIGLRHKLIHGVRGTVEPKYARRHTKIILGVTENIHGFAMSKGCDLDAKLPVRRRKTKKRNSITSHGKKKI